jgi:hypothetical protein
MQNRMFLRKCARWSYIEDQTPTAPPPNDIVAWQGAEPPPQVRMSLNSRSDQMNDPDWQMFGALHSRAA